MQRAGDSSVEPGSWRACSSEPGSRRPPRPLTTALAIAAAEATGSAQLVGAAAELPLGAWLLPLLTLVPLLYPDGLLPGTRLAVDRGASVAGTCLLASGVALYAESLVGRVEVPKLVTAPAMRQGADVLGAVVLVPCVVVALVASAVRYRRSTGLARRQVVVLLVAAGVLLAVTAAQGVLPSPADVLVQAAASLWCFWSPSVSR